MAFQPCGHGPVSLLHHSISNTAPRAPPKRDRSLYLCNRALEAILNTMASPNKTSSKDTSNTTKDGDGLIKASEQLSELQSKQKQAATWGNYWEGGTLSIVHKFLPKYSATLWEVGKGDKILYLARTPIKIFKPSRKTNLSVSISHTTIIKDINYNKEEITKTDAQQVE